MEPLSLLATALSQYLIPKALEKIGEEVGATAIARSEKSIQSLQQKVRSKLKAARTEGILTQAQNNPTEVNVQVLETVLLSQLQSDTEFAEQIQYLVEEINRHSPKLQSVLNNVRIQGSAKMGNIAQKSTGNTQQVIGQNLGVGGNIILGDIDQTID